MVIQKKKILDFSILSILFFCLIEKIYNRTGNSGIYSNYIYIIMLISLLVIKLIFNKGKIKNNSLELIGLCIVFCYGMNTYSLRYSVFFLILLVMNDFVIEDLEKYHKLLIIIGFLFCCYQLIFSSSRVSGYMISPTIFSCCTMISVLYLLFQKNFEIIDYFYIMLGIFSIYLTKSSSVFLFTVFLILYKFFVNLIRKLKANKTLKNKNKILYIFIILFLVVGGIIVFYNLNFFLSILKRDNRGASTNTRMFYYKLFFEQLCSSIKMVLIGNGAGYTTEFIKTVVSTKFYVPLHQDFLMFLCEYGVIGCLFMYLCYIKKMHMNWIMWLAIILCSFHNLVLSPVAVCLFVLTNNSLNSQYDKEKIWK